MKFADEWGNVYNTCILEFTGRNGAVVRSVPEVSDVVNKSGPLMQSLVALDKSPPEKSSPSDPDFKAGYKAYVTEQKKLITVANAYGVSLKAALVALNTKEAEFPTAFRAVKTLAKQMNVVVMRAEARTTTLSKEVQKISDKINKKAESEVEKLRGQGMDDQQIKVEVNWIKQQKMLLVFPSSTKAALAKAEAAVQKIKLKPTKAVYDKEMDGARDLTQNMSNVIKSLGDKNCPAELAQKMRGLVAYKTDLAAFGSGAKRTVDAKKTEAEILAQLKEFSALVKAMKPFYDDMVKYLAANK